MVGGLGDVDLLDAILADLRVARPPAVGIVSAYVTVSGVQRIKPVLDRVKVTTCRLVAGIDDEITHPEALKQGLPSVGTFGLPRHPRDASIPR